MPVNNPKLAAAIDYAKANVESETLGTITSIEAVGGRVFIQWSSGRGIDNYSEEQFIEKMKDIAAKLGDPVRF